MPGASVQVHLSLLFLHKFEVFKPLQGKEKTFLLKNIQREITLLKSISYMYFSLTVCYFVCNEFTTETDNHLLFYGEPFRFPHQQKVSPKRWWVP